jgi:hypothetical protein
MLDSFIPLELAVAPNPLGPALNLKLTTIPIDAYTCFELWMPPIEQPILPEEAMLLREDYRRVEEICARLLWLVGGKLSNQLGQSLTNSISPSIHNWQQILQHFHQSGQSFDTIGIAYLPQTVKPYCTGTGSLTAWAMTPVQWQITFLSLESYQSGYLVHPCSTTLVLTPRPPIVRPVDVSELSASI